MQELASRGSSVRAAPSRSQSQGKIFCFKKASYAVQCNARVRVYGHGHGDGGVVVVKLNSSPVNHATKETLGGKGG